MGLVEADGERARRIYVVVNPDKLCWVAVVLTAAAGAAAASFHWVSHVLDHDLVGAASDPWTLGVFALLLIAALVLRSPLRSGNRLAQARIGKREPS